MISVRICFVFGRLHLKLSDGRPATLTDLSWFSSLLPRVELQLKMRHKGLVPYYSHFVIQNHHLVRRSMKLIKRTYVNLEMNLFCLSSFLLPLELYNSEAFGLTDLDARQIHRLSECHGVVFASQMHFPVIKMV
jgi:hypothetical protein